MLRTRAPLAAALAAVASTALATTLLAVPVQADDSGGPAGAPPWKTVATGLDNPRLLSFSGHALYVAEAGVGGAGPCVEGPEGESCFGLSGAITRITHHGSRRVVTGLPSLASPEGGGAIGPADVVVPAHRRGSKHHFAATIGLGNDPEVRDTFGAAGRALGTVVTGNLKGGPVHIVSDLAAYEQERDPDGNGPDSNPTGLMRDGGSVVVTDSGANDLLRVRHHRGIRTLAVFPNTEVPDPFVPGAVVPMQAVPTSVVRGPDDAYYISQLTGFPFPDGRVEHLAVRPRRGADRLRDRAHQRDRPGVAQGLALRRPALRHGPAHRARGCTADRLAREGGAGSDAHPRRGGSARPVRRGPAWRQGLRDHVRGVPRRRVGGEHRPGLRTAPGRVPVVA